MNRAEQGLDALQKKLDEDERLLLQTHRELIAEWKKHKQRRVMADELKEYTQEKEPC